MSVQLNVSSSLPPESYTGGGPIRFTRLYIGTLVSLAILLSVAEIITQWQIDKFQDELTVIRYAATQRHQSQQLAKKALQMAATTNQTNFQANQRELGVLFKSIEHYHLNGRQGVLTDSTGKIASHEIPNSHAVERRYEEVRPHFEALQGSVGQLLTVESPAQLNTPTVKASLALLLANETPFLEKIDLVVQQYTAELRQKLTRLQRTELWLHLLTLLTLGAIAFFVYRPALNRLHDTIQRLVEADQRTTDVNRKLTAANRSLKKARQQLFDATKLQFEQQINEQKLRTAYLMAGQEEERKRLSRELHDGLGQMLTAIKLQVEGLEGRLLGEGLSNVNLSPLKTLITQTIQETRSISNNLMPSALSDFGLVSGLRTLVDTHNRSGSGAGTLAISLTADDQLSHPDRRLEKSVEITLYRVTQEALTNAIRHGKADNVYITLFEKDHFIHLTVVDDGEGFRTQRLNTEPHGQGIHNIHERIKLLNGRFKLTSSPGKGTKLRVSIPCHPQQIAQEYDQLNAG